MKLGMKMTKYVEIKLRSHVEHWMGNGTSWIYIDILAIVIEKQNSVGISWFDVLNAGYRKSILNLKKEVRGTLISNDFFLNLL